MFQRELPVVRGAGGEERGMVGATYASIRQHQAHHPVLSVRLADLHAPGSIIERGTAGAYSGYSGQVRPRMQAVPAWQPLYNPQSVISPQISPAWRGSASSTSSEQSKVFLKSMNADYIQQRFRQLLGLLQSKGIFRRAAAEARKRGGPLRLSLPFCGGCLEAPLLAEFLASLLDKETDLPGAEVLCSDVAAETGVSISLSAVKHDPRIRFSAEVIDLGRMPLPAADLILGFHPEASRSDTRPLWREVIANCCRAAPLAVFTTLADVEANFVREFAMTAGCVAEHAAGVAEDLMATSAGNASAGYDGRRYAHLVIASRR